MVEYEGFCEYTYVLEPLSYMYRRHEPLSVALYCRKHT